jgi:hypothetical protein
MSQKITSGPAPAPATLQPRRPFQFSEYPAPASGAWQEPQDDIQVPPPPPPPRIAQPPPPTISWTEQVQGIWYGWA